MKSGSVVKIDQLRRTLIAQRRQSTTDPGTPAAAVVVRFRRFLVVLDRTDQFAATFPNEFA